MRNVLLSLISGIVVGVIATLAVCHLLDKPKSIDASAAIVTPISGSPISVNKITYDKKHTIINTSYEGAGESSISIPNSINPSANAWDNYHWGVGGMVSTDNSYYVLASYRYNRLMGIGSIWYRNKTSYDFGVTIGAMFLFGE